jgi:O-antigen/teichoic acid export membrane protein
MLTTKTLLGAGWTVSSRLTGRLIDFGTVLVLARTLTPADFGLTALAMTLTVITDMVLEIPLIASLTRLSHVEKAHLDTAFTLGALRGLVLAVVILLAAWPFSLIYHDSRLVPLVAVIAIGPIARSLYSPAMVHYIRNMSFQQVFLAEILGKMAAFVVAVSVTYLGGGYWAIAANSVAAPFAAMIISYFIAPYSPKLSLAKLSDSSAFLGWLSMSQVVAALSWQFDRILLGYFITKADLGRYAMASDLSVLPLQSLITPAMQPVMTAFAKITHDRDRLRKAYSKASHFTMMLAAPACVGMSLTSDLIFDVLFGPKWAAAAIYLQWMALATVLGAFYQPLHSLALATNRTNVVFRLVLIELSCKIVLMSLGLYFYSVMGVIAARGIVSVILFILSLRAAQQLVGAHAAAEVAHLWKVGASCALMAVLVMMLRHELAEQNINPVLEFVATSAFGAVAYVGTLFMLGVRIKTFSTQAA